MHLTPYHRRRSGFSFIELILVVTIIGIIAALVVPRISVSTDASKDTVEDHHLAQLNSLCEQYYLTQGGWPATLADLQPVYLPDGIPANPNGGSYTFNTTTNRVEVGP